MIHLPIPLPADPDLAQFVLARYEAADKERADMALPPMVKDRDGVLTALHFFYQNSPVVFAGGCLFTALAIVRILWRAMALF